jgi:hypothetical protein
MKPQHNWLSYTDMPPSLKIQCSWPCPPSVYVQNVLLCCSSLVPWRQANQNSLPSARTTACRIPASVHTHTPIQSTNLPDSHHLMHVGAALLCHHYRCTKQQLPRFLYFCFCILPCHLFLHPHTRCASRALLLYLQRTTEALDTIQAPAAAHAIAVKLVYKLPHRQRQGSRHARGGTPHQHQSTPLRNTRQQMQSPVLNPHTEQKHCSPQVLRLHGYASVAACIRSARQCCGCPCTWFAPTTLPIQDRHNKRTQKLPSNVIQSTARNGPSTAPIQSFVAAVREEHTRTF